MELNAKDRKLISLLRQDARLPITSLAQHLNVSRATVQNRITRLTQKGIIQGFSVRLNDSVQPSRVRAITLINVKPKKTNDVLKSLTGVPEINQLHTTNGRWDIVAELNTETLSEFDAALSYIREIEGVASTETSLLLTSHKI